MARRRPRSDELDEAVQALRLLVQSCDGIIEVLKREKCVPAGFRLQGLEEARAIAFPGTEDPDGMIQRH